MTEKAKFKYSASEGVLELEGSEEFVTKHFESLTDMVRVISRHVPVESKADSVPVTLVSADVPNTALPVNETAAGSDTKTINSYPEYFSEINGKLKVVVEINGSSKKGKMLNAALLFCYGSELLGDEQVASKDIRQVCEEHGILDAANFASVFSDKTIFLSDGVKGGNKDVKLTFQGKKKARELLGNVDSTD
jgi:hypothetical protein